MQNDMLYNATQRRYYVSYITDVKELTNRQLLRQAREEREQLAEIAEGEARQAGKSYMWFRGDNLRIVKMWLLKTQAVTLRELAARGYICKGDKYVKGKVLKAA